MRELGQILELWRKLEEAGEQAVLATVVRTLGSAYRLPGARLLLSRTGQRAGSVSGGCLEDDLVKKSWWLTQGGPALRRYDTTPDGEIGSGFGLGCNGIIDILLQRLEPGVTSVLSLLDEVRQRRQPAAIAHVIEPPPEAGRQLLLNTEGRVSTKISDPVLAGKVEQEARRAVSGGTAQHVTCEGSQVFVETVVPPVRLLIFGAGDDAVPLTELGKFLGWTVYVIDGRGHYARREKFPDADRVSLRSSDGPIAYPEVDPWTVAVLMTHSYSQDLGIVQELAVSPPRFLGLLGPQKRSAQLIKDAGLSPAQIAPVLHSPIGLDIGADGPHQVALAIVAEIQAVLNGRPGGELRKRKGSIHAPEGTPESEGAFVRSIVCA